MLSVLLSVAAAAGVFVLPGLGVKELARLGAGSWRRETAAPQSTSFTEQFAVAIAWSAIALSVIGAVLIGLGIFDFTILGIATAVLAIAGLPSLVRMLRPLRWQKWLVAGGLVLLAIPYVWTATRSNLTPTHSYQWYYWDLGRQLDIAGGVPKSVLEFGLAVRWHPDYVLAVIQTGAYHAFTFPLSQTEAIGAYRVPILLMAVAGCYVVFRLWTRVLPALIGAAAVSATTLFITKFASYKPETMALAAGLFATWLLVTAIRRKSRGMTLLAGALFGIAVGMHGIAATVTGMIAVSAALVEIWNLGPAHRKAMFGNAIRGGILAIVIVVGTGLALQGRAVVAADAGHPKLEHGEDPTWAFLNRDDGTFYFPPQPTVGSQASDTLRHPWPGGLVGNWGWALASALVLAAAAASLRRPGRRRAAALTLFGTAALIGIAMLLFGLKYHTFIPQHTGLTRIAIYLGLLYGLGLALAAEFVIDWLARFELDEMQAAVVGMAAVVFFAVWAIGVGLPELDKYGGIGSEGREALSVLKKERLGTDEAVLSNISTRGLIGFTTGLQAPIEGRQPVIEDPEFLTDANRALVEIHEYLDHPTSAALPRRMGARWLLISNGSRGFGSPFDLGPPTGEVQRIAEQPYVEEVWHSRNLALFKLRGTVAAIEPVGPHKTLGLRVLLALLAIGVSTLVLWRVELPSRRRTTEATPAAA
jgi:hypothetical protein